MKIGTMLTYFLGPRQETTRTAVCNYLASEVENLEEGDFQIFRNKAVKLLSGTQSKAGEKNRHPQQPTLYRISSTISTFATKLSTATTATSNRCQVLHFNYSRNQIPACQVVQPAQWSQVVTEDSHRPEGSRHKLELQDSYISLPPTAHNI